MKGILAYRKVVMQYSLSPISRERETISIQLKALYITRMSYRLQALFREYPFLFMRYDAPPV